MPISNPSWPKVLKQSLKPDNLDKDRLLKIAILGIGNELNGDDAIGPRVVKRLRAAQSRGKLSNQNSQVFLVDAGLAPENFTGLLRTEKPTYVLLIDAAQMGLAPGEIQMIDWQEINGVSAFTHSLPLSTFAGYLTGEIGCKLFILGVEPLQLDPFQPLSCPVEKALRRITRALIAILE